MKLLMFGPPGSGKGTISKVLAQKADVPHISTGALIREHIQAHDHLGEEFEKYTQKGQLAPDQLTIELVEDRLKKDDIQKGFLFDGFPRNLNQAVYVKEHIPITGVVFIDVTDELILKRLLARGRADDSEEIIKKRIADYHSQTKPILDFFKEHNIPIYDQNGDYDINLTGEVAQKIIDWQNSL